MPWFPMDTHYLDDPKVQAAGEATPFALSVFPALLAQAKLRADGGRVEFTYRDLAHRLYLSTEEAAKAVAALVGAGLLQIERQDDRSARAAFPSASWERWNSNLRKAQSRASKAA